jgi:hypothetical protein
MNDEQTTTAEGPPAGREPKVIKRYTNRKLYDTVESRYVTLDEIAEMIKGGQEVKVVDNRSKEDLTSVTLAQIIFEEEKKTSKMSLRSGPRPSWRSASRPPGRWPGSGWPASSARVPRPATGPRSW